MASIGKGDGRAAFRSCINSSSHLPPRSPCFPNMGSTSFHSNTSFFTGGKSFTHNVGQRQHQRTPSASFLMEQPSWLDDLLEDSEVPSRKVSHRRSASDSFTFSEAHGNLYKISNIAEEEEFDCSGVATLNSQGFKDFDHYNEDQLMSLYVEIEQLQKKQNLPVSGTVTPILCSSQLENARTRIKGTSASTAESCTASDSTSGTGASSDGMLRHLDCEAEVRRAGDRNISDQYCVRDESSSVAVPNDPNLDSKQAKRHSAQRSRVRKLQYIAELESSVNALQAEVSALSPQMTYVERQLVLLKADNKALKQRVNFLLQDKKLKEAQIEIQKREVQKYGKLYQIQLQRQLQQNQNHKQHEEYQKLGEHRDESFEKSLPSDLDLHPDEFSNLNLGSQLANSRPLVSDALVGLMKNLSGLSIGTGTNMGPSLHGLKTGIPSSCTVGAGGKSLEGRLTAGSALMASDFMIQNS